MKKFALLALVLTLAACAGDDKPDEAKKAENEAKTAAPKIKTDDLICPQVAILQEAEEISDYGGEEPDPSQLVAKARMVSIAGDCSYRKDGIDISFSLHLTARRGPRLGGEQVSFPYFVAIVDPAENIPSRQVVTAQFKFSGLDKTAEDDEALHVFIPLPQKDQLSGPNYRVLTGFQLPKSRGQAG